MFGILEGEHEIFKAFEDKAIKVRSSRGCQRLITSEVVDWACETGAKPGWPWRA